MAIFSNRHKNPNQPSTTYNPTNAERETEGVPANNIAPEIGEGAFALTQLGEDATTYQIPEATTVTEVERKIELGSYKRRIEDRLAQIETGAMDPSVMSFDIRDIVAELRRQPIDAATDLALSAIITQCGAIESVGRSGRTPYENAQAARRLLDTF